MSKAVSEYEVEKGLIDRLDEMGYDYIEMRNYDDVIQNFRKQICKVNEKKLVEMKDVADKYDGTYEEESDDIDKYEGALVDMLKTIKGSEADNLGLEQLIGFMGGVK